jgi:threonine/homoserine/homoserine lactone efflux protein
MLLGILIGFLGSCFGWQIDLLAIQRGVRRGKIAAFPVGCGAIAADMIFLAIGFAGTQPISEHPEWWGLIRWIGISVILVLAARVFFVHGKTPPEVSVAQQKASPRNFLVGFLVVVTNPVVFLMWVWVIGFLQAHFQEAREPWFREFFLAVF